MFAVGAEHGLSRDDRRFYFDVLNETLIPIYNDGAVRIFSGDKFGRPNNYSSIKNQLNRNKRFSYSAKLGSPHVIKKIDNLDIKNLKNILKTRGLDVPISDLTSVIKLIRKNLVLLSDLNKNQIYEVSNLNQHPLKNKEALKKNIQASYIFTNNNNYKKCDLLLDNCENLELSSKKLRKALKQDLTDSEGNELIFLGNIDKFKKTQIQTENSADIKNVGLISLEDFKFKIFGNIHFEIDELNKIIKFSKKEKNSRVLFFDSILNNWNLEFVDLIEDDTDLISRDQNGLSGCLNIYDSKINDLKILTKNTKCEDAVNFVRTEGAIADLKIENSLFDGLDADFSNLIIKNIEVKKSGNDCLDFSYGKYNLYQLNLSNCEDKGVSIGEGSNLTLNEFVIKDSIIGIASKDSAIVNSKNGLIQNVDKCLSLYKKNKNSMEDFLNIKI